MKQSNLAGYAVPTLIGTGAGSKSHPIAAIPVVSSLRSSRDGVSSVTRRKRKAVLNIQLGVDRERCDTCHGDGKIPCRVCVGTGSLPRGAFKRNNTVHFPSLVGSKWTSVTAIDGKWRHFICVNKQGSTVTDAVVTLASTCGPNSKRTRFDILAVDLKKRAHWLSGWITLNDLDDASKAHTACPSCKGEAHIPCSKCKGSGQTGLF